MLLYEVKATERTAPSEVHLCRFLSILKSTDNQAIAKLSFWDYDSKQKKIIFSEEKVTFWNNDNELNADMIKSTESGAYLVAQIGTRKSGEKVCVRFVDKNHRLTIGSGNDEANIFFGRANKPEIGSKDIKGQPTKCLSMMVPIKLPDGTAEKCSIEMLESQKYARVDKAFKLVSENTLVALVCGKRFGNTYSAFKVGVPTEQRVTKEKEITPKTNGADPGDTVLLIGTIGEKLQLSVKDTYKDHKEWVEFIAYEWEPWSADMSKLESMKAQKQACRDFLDKMGVKAPEKI